MLIGRDKNYKNPDKDRECFTVSALAEEGKDGVTQETCHEVGPWIGTGQNVSFKPVCLFIILIPCFRSLW